MRMCDTRNITLNQLRKLIASGDDRHDNQIRVSKNGMVYLSQDIVGADQLEDVAFRFETFDSGNDYVGKEASEDDDHVKPIYRICDYGKYC